MREQNQRGKLQAVVWLSHPDATNCQKPSRCQGLQQDFPRSLREDDQTSLRRYITTTSIRKPTYQREREFKVQANGRSYKDSQINESESLDEAKLSTVVQPTIVWCRHESLLSTEWIVWAKQLIRIPWKWMWSSVNKQKSGRMKWGDTVVYSSLYNKKGRKFSGREEKRQKCVSDWVEPEAQVKRYVSDMFRIRMGLEKLLHDVHTCVVEGLHDVEKVYGLSVYEYITTSREKYIFTGCRPPKKSEDETIKQHLC